MGQRRIKMVVPTFLILIGLTFYTYDEIQLHAALKALARDCASFVQTIDTLRIRNDDLVNEASTWRQRAADAQKRSSQLPVRESRKAAAAGSRGLARPVHTGY